jgi:hypothetical protein
MAFFFALVVATSLVTLMGAAYLIAFRELQQINGNLKAILTHLGEKQSHVAPLADPVLEDRESSRDDVRWVPRRSPPWNN